MADKRTAFDPAVHGFGFPNAFHDDLLTLPNGMKISTAGRCGGMAYLSLDLFHSGAPAPRWGAGLYAPKRVPPDENWLADVIRGRLFDSFKVLSAATFITWSMHPDGALGPLKGVARWTSQDELPQVVRAVDEGRPVPLGLVVARSIGAIGKNHQVVAHGYARTGDVTSLLITDSNSPGQEVTLTPVKGGWKASNGPTWRGFFVQDYKPRKPTVLTRAPADPARAIGPGSVVVLSHVWTGMTLHADRTPWSYDGCPLGTRVTAVRSTATDDECWAVEAGTAGRVRLRHVATGSYLGSPRGSRSPVTGQQGVRVGSTPNEWRVEVDGTWTAGARVRLVHAETGAALHSHLHADERTTGGQQEVTGFAGRDDNDWWTVLEAR
ncbi:hypothetical protein [Cellulomonas rhizosphaerae]|uniref:MIR domain-containing protein n=1 Tax=Cellulomonas rhizosphaerae TaxID=2293719 RepID=A0A413RL21_9CELL|nr:hypothetical protein [Cellulomonas rhizosphaerae]RHA40115.1 hypothetical protein D1825_10715 [Cellulomonas rhizosphaerae]